MTENGEKQIKPRGRLAEVSNGSSFKPLEEKRKGGAKGKKGGAKSSKKQAAGGNGGGGGANQPARGPNGQLLPGSTGNPNGRPKKQECVTHWAREKLEANNCRRAKKVAEMLVSKAEKGDVKTAKELLNRVEGRPAYVTHNHHHESEPDWEFE